METTFEDAMDSCYQIMLNEWTKEEIIEYFKEREKHSVEVVRCGECKYSREFDGKIEWCSRTMQYVPKDFHCGVKGLKS